MAEEPDFEQLLPDVFFPPDDPKITTTTTSSKKPRSPIPKPPPKKKKKKTTNNNGSPPRQPSPVNRNLVITNSNTASVRLPSTPPQSPSVRTVTLDPNTPWEGVWSYLTSTGWSEKFHWTSPHSAATPYYLAPNGVDRSSGGKFGLDWTDDLIDVKRFATNALGWNLSNDVPITKPFNAINSGMLPPINSDNDSARNEADTTGESSLNIDTPFTSLSGLSAKRRFMKATYNDNVLDENQASSSDSDPDPDPQPNSKVHASPMLSPRHLSFQKGSKKTSSSTSLLEDTEEEVVEPDSLISTYFVKYLTKLSNEKQVVCWEDRAKDRHPIYDYKLVKSAAKRMHKESKKRKRLEKESKTSGSRKELMDDSDDDLIGLGASEYYQRYKKIDIATGNIFKTGWRHKFHKDERFIPESLKYALIERMKIIRGRDLTKYVYKKSEREYRKDDSRREKAEKEKNERIKNCQDQPYQGIMQTDGLPVKTFSKETNYLPMVKLTTVNNIDGTKYDFKLFTAESSIPNSGNGAFITLEKVWKIKDSNFVYISSATDKKKEKPKSYLAKGFEDYLVEVVLNPPPDQLGLPPSPPEEDIEYVEDPRGTFCSDTLGNGCVDLGRYAPFTRNSRKPIHIFSVKDFLFDSTPSEWVFDARSKIRVEGAAEETQKLDITDDWTGDPAWEACKEIAMYVNEVGHAKNRVKTVLADDISSTLVGYRFCWTSSIFGEFKVGQTKELLTNYGPAYEIIREIKGYSKKDMEKKGNNIQPTISLWRTISRQVEKLNTQFSDLNTFNYNDIVSLISFTYFRVFTPLTMICAIDSIKFSAASSVGSRLRSALESDRISRASAVQYSALFKISWIADVVMRKLKKVVERECLIQEQKSKVTVSNTNTSSSTNTNTNKNINKKREVKLTDEESVALMDWKGVAMFCVGESVVVKGYEEAIVNTKDGAAILAETDPDGRRQSYSLCQIAKVNVDRVAKAVTYDLQCSAKFADGARAEGDLKGVLEEHLCRVTWNTETSLLPPSEPYNPFSERIPSICSVDSLNKALKEMKSYISRWSGDEANEHLMQVEVGKGEGLSLKNVVERNVCNELCFELRKSIPCMFSRSLWCEASFDLQRRLTKMFCDLKLNWLGYSFEEMSEKMPKNSKKKLLKMTLNAAADCRTVVKDAIESNSNYEEGDGGGAGGHEELAALVLKGVMKKSVPDLRTEFLDGKGKAKWKALNKLNPNLTDHIDMKYLTMDPISNVVLKECGQDEDVSAYKVGDTVPFLYVKPSVNIKGVDLIPVAVERSKLYEMDEEYFICMQIYPVVEAFCGLIKFDVLEEEEMLGSDSGDSDDTAEKELNLVKSKVKEILGMKGSRPIVKRVGLLATTVK
ncbi:hypothetical protein TrST_g2567 [Triparma strigata]|uniref:Uncharacterized protein n=1 Tax=Triparma strigata TaxID=1606541 RepID=A0A9W7BXA7_9STRA|nr:hypothetical protein TrST_g2567 [Triparma strigata]